MISVTGSDSPAADPAPLGEPDHSRDAAHSEAPFPKRRDLRHSDKPYSPDDPDSNPTPEAVEEFEEPEPKDYGRAGRNLPAAIGMGMLIGGVVLASLVFLPDLVPLHRPHRHRRCDVGTGECAFAFGFPRLPCAHHGLRGLHGRGHLVYRRS